MLGASVLKLVKFLLSGVSATGAIAGLITTAAIIVLFGLMLIISIL